MHDLEEDGAVEKAAAPAASPCEPATTQAQASPEGLGFDLLHERLRLLVLRVCRRILGPSDGAEDAAQEVWIRLWTVLRTGQRIDDPARFVVRAARDRASSLVRCRRSRRRREAEHELDRRSTQVADATPLELASLEELRTRLPALLEHLSQQQRRILTERLAGRTIPEIAAQLELSEGAVQQQLARALARIGAIFPEFM